MYETVDPPSSTHIPAPYEEVGVVTGVKNSRDIQLPFKQHQILPMDKWPCDPVARTCSVCF